MTKQYDEKFKQMIINKKNGGESVSNLAREFDISRAAIYVWLKEAMNKDTPTELHGETNFQKEYYKLLNEKKTLENDMDALKKCISIFSKM